MAKIVQLTDNDTQEAIYPAVAKEQLLDVFHPMGAIYETTDSQFDPNDEFGGQWTLDSSEKKHIFVNSQQLFSSNTNTTSGTTNIIGAYDFNLIEGVWTGITIPSGFHKSYKLTCQVSTSSSNTAKVALNNIQTDAQGTYSATTFRKIVSSNYFVESQITLEPTMGYTSRNGINCKVINSGTQEARFYCCNLLAYLESDDIYYTWRRIA